MTRSIQWIGLGTCLICAVVLANRLVQSPSTTDVSATDAGDMTRVSAETSFDWQSHTPQSAATPSGSIVLTAFAETDRVVDGSLRVVPVQHDSDHRDAVEQAIIRRFPSLDKDVLAGWTDAYADLPLSELAALLEQRAMIPRITPAGSFLSSEFSISLRKTPAANLQGNVFEQLRTILLDNMRHVDTPGHRRRQFLTMLNGLSATVEASAIRLAEPSFDFSVADAVASENPLHVAIMSHRQAMFRLEPGCVLTRCGTFERLEDGQLGLRNGMQSLALYGGITIPADAVGVQIDSSGRVTHRSNVDEDEDEADGRMDLGQIQIALIDNMSLLQSSNGVFFTIPDDKISNHLQMTSGIPLKSQSVELSNVDAEAEVRVLDRWKRLQN